MQHGLLQRTATPSIGRRHVAAQAVTVTVALAVLDAARSGSHALVPSPRPHGTERATLVGRGRGAFRWSNACTANRAPVPDPSRNAAVRAARLAGTPRGWRTTAFAAGCPAAASAAAAAAAPAGHRGQPLLARAVQVGIAVPAAARRAGLYLHLHQGVAIERERQVATGKRQHVQSAALNGQAAVTAAATSPVAPEAVI
jgi:hypothetical protein